MTSKLFLAGAFLITLPGLGLELVGIHPDPVLSAFLLGLAVVGAAFLLSWASEVAQRDIPPALALSVLALIAVLPEYSVDFALTYRAGSDPVYQEFAVANMIGANRMIVGFAWPLIVFLFWWRFHKMQVKLEIGQRVEVGYLLLAGLYSLVIPIKGRIDIIDFVVLIGIFALYTFRISRSEVEEPELIGPAEMLGRLSTTGRRTAVVAMIVFAAAVIFVVAHPFADALIHTGTALGIDEVFMIQWFAPLASEAPEIIVTVIFTLRGAASAGMGTLVASKINQWTLLVGTLPLVFSLGAGRFQPLPLSDHQVGAMLVTAGQTLVASLILINLSAHVTEAALLFGLLVAQFFFNNSDQTELIFAAIYLGLALVFLVRNFKDLKPTVLAAFNFKSAHHPAQAKPSKLE